MSMIVYNHRLNHNYLKLNLIPIALSTIIFSYILFENVKIRVIMRNPSFDMLSYNDNSYFRMNIHCIKEK